MVVDGFEFSFFLFFLFFLLLFVVVGGSGWLGRWWIFFFFLIWFVEVSGCWWGQWVKVLFFSVVVYGGGWMWLVEAMVGFCWLWHGW